MKPMYKKTDKLRKGEIIRCEVGDFGNIIEMKIINVSKLSDDYYELTCRYNDKTDRTVKLYSKDKYSEVVC